MFSDPTNPAPRHGLFYESHTIETPEQTNIEFTVAGIGSRALALLVDSAIQAVVMFVGVIVFAIVLPSFWAKSRALGLWVVAGLIVAGFLVYYGYFILFEIFWNGQTPGKRNVGIRVIKDTGRRLSALETIARNLLRIVDQLPGFYAVAMIVSLFNRQNKRLGDFVAGSLVVREASVPGIKRGWYQTSHAQRIRAPLGADRLSDEELILIESFLQRRHELDPAIRWRMATEIFRRVENKLTFSPEERPAVEHLLEAAVHERRGGTYTPSS